MSRIHYFQRYDSKENWITNSTLLLLSRLYNYNRLKFQTVVNEILAENNLSLNIGVNFNQQQWGASSVVDGVISQDSFKIVIETKLADNFDATQLKNHLSTLTSTAGNKILLALSKGLVSLSVRKDVIAELQKDEYKGIQFASTTYSIIIKIIQETLADYEVEMKEILDDYILICKEHHLTDIENHTMLAVTATTSIVVNKKYNIYYDPATRSHNIPFKYLALYLDKNIVDIGQLKKVVYCDYEDGNLISSDETPLTLTTDEYERIKHTIEETTYYDLRKGVKFFLVDQFIPTDFRKVSFSSLRAKKYFFLNEFKNYKESMNTSEIANLLRMETW
jgi:hypothetical protein